MSWAQPFPEEEKTLARRMRSLSQEFSDHLTMIGDMPMPSVEFAKYNLE